ncbi:AAA family ATPase [Tardiphaga sp.]|uniref:AAA family ATPase n=1 Tax=Tardiphaga sp. TaxID=1926292 RepID=UPI002611D18C|nr:AAA family ATPase [Tardiphaga sp.]MDB5615925.1 RecA-family ATPase [Tardiphaga sp.]
MDIVINQDDPFETFMVRRQIEREQDVNLDDIVPIDARLAVAFTDDDIESLTEEHWADGHYPTKWQMVPTEEGGGRLTPIRMSVDSIGWDLFRHGRMSGCGEDQFHRLLIGRDEHYAANTRHGLLLTGQDGGDDFTDIDAATAEREAYVAARFATFNRKRLPTDLLLIDLADDALHQGWQAPPAIVAAVERLRAIAANVPHRRKATEAIKAHREDERELEEWRLAQAPPVAKEDARMARHDSRVAAQRAANEAQWQITLDHSAVSARATTDAMQEAADANEEAAMIAWQVKYGHLFPEQSDPPDDAAGSDIAPSHLAPGTPMPTPPKLTVVPTEPLPDLIQSSGEFVRGFVPPDYLVDGVLQRRFVYSITAQTGVGKTAIAMLISAHVATGRKLGNLDVEKGCVLYFAGENPTDIQMRWLGSTQSMSIDPETTDVHFVPGATALSGIAARITEEITRKGLKPSLVVVDTAAAYFEGDDENSNTQAVDHARRLRSLTMLPGGPTVIILCHPTKRAAADDLIPRGGGAFLNEVDGNIALRKQDTLIGAEVQGKFRGREFSPIHFELNTVYHPILKDARGRDIPTVVARVIDDTTKQRLADAAVHSENALLKVIFDQPGASLRTMAMVMGWTDAKGQPAAMRVSRACDALAKEKMIVKHRNTWQCTPAGQKELNQLDGAVTRNVTPMPPLPPFPPR